VNDDYYWVQAAPFRALLDRLIDITGLPWSALAHHGRLPPRLVHHLLFGRGGRRLARIPRDCAQRILALDEQRLREVARWEGLVLPPSLRYSEAG
jgi:hypothetical protein